MKQWRNDTLIVLLTNGVWYYSKLRKLVHVYAKNDIMLLVKWDLHCSICHTGANFNSGDR